MPQCHSLEPECETLEEGQKPLRPSRRSSSLSPGRHPESGEESVTQTLAIPKARLWSPKIHSSMSHTGTGGLPFRRGSA